MLEAKRDYVGGFSWGYCETLYVINGWILAHLEVLDLILTTLPTWIYGGPGVAEFRGGLFLRSNRQK